MQPRLRTGREGPGEQQPQTADQQRLDLEQRWIRAGLEVGSVGGRLAMRYRREGQRYSAVSRRLKKQAKSSAGAGSTRSACSGKARALQAGLLCSVLLVMVLRALLDDVRRNLERSQITGRRVGGIPKREAEELYEER